MRLLLTFFLVLGLSVFSFGQKDFGLWSGIDLRLPVTKKLDFGLEIQARFENNISKVNSSFLSPYVKYEILRHLGAGLDYRFTNVAGPTGFFGSMNEHRFTIDVEGKKLLDFISKDLKLDASIRLRYTHETTAGDRNNDYWRTQFELKYDLKKLDLKPELAVEFFYHFNDQYSYSFNEVRSSGRFNKFRIRLGMNYAFNKRDDIKVFYMVQPRMESTKTDFVLGLGFTHRFKRLGKKK